MKKKRQKLVASNPHPKFGRCPQCGDPVERGERDGKTFFFCRCGWRDWS